MNGSLFDLTGKVALVTGGSRGLGKAMVLAFAAQGADVIVASRKRPACEEVAAEVQQRFGRRALPVDAVTESFWDRVLAINLKGPFRLTALVGTRMAAGDGGST